MNDLRLLGADQMDGVVALVMELAAQLHEERAQRIALQVVLEEAGLLAPDAVERVGAAADERTRSALDASVAGLMRVMAEGGPPQHPIRHEARNDAATVTT